MMQGLHGDIQNSLLDSTLMAQQSSIRERRNVPPMSHGVSLIDGSRRRVKFRVDIGVIVLHVKDTDTDIDTRFVFRNARTVTARL